MGHITKIKFAVAVELAKFRLNKAIHHIVLASTTR